MMEYLRIENDFPRISHSAVTLGKFDGIHRGHQKLVEKIIEQKQEGAQAVVLALGTASRTILTKEERCRILEEMGDRKSTRLNSSHVKRYRMPSSA